MSADKVFTSAEVAKHNTDSDCYYILHGKVYDVTSFLNEHPGGEEVMLDHAGTDCTEAFEDVGHSEDARQDLKALQIGVLDPKELAEQESKEVIEQNTPPAIPGRGGSNEWLTYVGIGVAIAIGALAYTYFNK
eukprot:m.19237 g.19237  ORF g.19237 m.19237 type:complete len:133 (-) comp5084_c1_seq1:350-748(-)